MLKGAEAWRATAARLMLSSSRVNPIAVTNGIARSDLFLSHSAICPHPALCPPLASFSSCSQPSLLREPPRRSR